MFNIFLVTWITLLSLAVLWLAAKLMDVNKSLKIEVERLGSFMNGFNYAKGGVGSQLYHLEGSVKTQVERITALYDALGYVFVVEDQKRNYVARKVAE